MHERVMAVDGEHATTSCQLQDQLLELYSLKVGKVATVCGFDRARSDHNDSGRKNNNDGGKR